MSSVLHHPGVVLESEADAYEYLERMRWGDDGPTDCPHCGSTKGAWFLQPKDPAGRKSKGGSSARSQRRVWKCRENRCRRQFSVLTNTVMHATKIPVRAWVEVVFALATEPGGVSAREIADRWELTPKSAWAMLERIENALVFPDATGRSVTDRPRWRDVTDDVEPVIDAREAAARRAFADPLSEVVSGVVEASPEVPGDLVSEVVSGVVEASPEVPGDLVSGVVEAPSEVPGDLVSDAVSGVVEASPMLSVESESAALGTVESAGSEPESRVAGTVETTHAEPVSTPFDALAGPDNGDAIAPMYSPDEDVTNGRPATASMPSSAHPEPSDTHADRVRSDVEQLLAEAFAGSSFDPAAARETAPGAVESQLREELSEGPVEPVSATPESVAEASTEAVAPAPKSVAESSTDAVAAAPEALGFDAGAAAPEAAIERDRSANDTTKQRPTSAAADPKEPAETVSENAAPTVERRRRRRRPGSRKRSVQPVDNSTDEAGRSRASAGRRGPRSATDPTPPPRRERPPAPTTQGLDSLGGGWLSAPDEQPSSRLPGESRPAPERHEEAPSESTLALGPQWAAPDDEGVVVDARDEAAADRATAGSTKGSRRDG